MSRIRSNSSWRFYFSTALKGAKRHLKLPVGSTRHLAVPVVAAAMSGLMAVSLVRAGDVAAGSDLFDTSDPIPSGPATTYDGVSLPADFFGPGSDPFVGMVEFQGNSFPIPGPSGDVMVDTIVERLDDATFTGDPPQDTVDTQMKALSLISVSPITVTFNGGLTPSQYDVQACLSSTDAQPIGSMTIQHLCPEGGRFDSITPVIPKLIFTKVSGGMGSAQVELDPAPQLNFSVINSCWSHTDPGYDLATTTGGVADFDCDGYIGVCFLAAPQRCNTNDDCPPGDSCLILDPPFAASTSGPDGFYLGVCWYPCTGGGVAAPMQSSPTPELVHIDEIELMARHGIGPAADDCRPASDGLSCVGDCPDPEICVPKRVRRVPGAAQGPDFPPAGIDILTRTGGWIVIHDKSDPDGVFRTYNINPEPPNITVVERGEPYYNEDEQRRQIDTEIVEMELTAHDGGGGGGGVFVHLNPDLPSDGVIHPVTTTGDDFPADSFFDVYVSIEIPGLEEALYNLDPIPLAAHEIMEIPPYEVSFTTPPFPLWEGAWLFYADGTISPYWIVEVVHWLPPPPPPYRVIDCECVDPDDPTDPDACHAELDPVGDVYCVGPCPPGEECNLIGYDTDQDGIDDEFECLCSTPPDFHASPANDSWIIFDDAGDVPSLPAGFFGPGSDPFDGLVYFEGDPIDPVNMGDTSTVLRRSADPFEPDDPPSGPVTVELELVELSLKSVDPIIVTYTGGPAPEEWDVHVGLSTTVTDPPGTLTATKTHANGGTYDVTIFVTPLLTFTRVSDGTTVELDWAELDPPYGEPFELQGTDNSWVHHVDSFFDVYYHPEADWVGGIEETEPGDTSSQVRDPLAVLPPDGEEWLVHGVIPPVDPWYWKDYNAGEPDGYMPDFDQNQDFDNADEDNDPATGPDTGYCGPTAVANSIWWFDHKFPEREIVDPAKTIYEVIEELAGYMGTNDGAAHPSPNGHPGPYGGTYVDDMQTGIDNYLAAYGIDDLLYEHTQPMPDFDYIANEVERCQDVVLLLGFWHIDLVEFDPASGDLIIWWARHGGHYVTVAGVNRTARMIAISDPDADAAEAGAPGVVRGVHNHGATDFRDPNYDHTLHNDKPLASHDYYGVGPSPSPGGIEALLSAGDPLIYGPPMVPYHRNENEDSLPPIPIWYPPGAWDDFGYPWPDYCQFYTEIEYAVVVSPYQGACCLPDNTCIVTTEPECTAQGGTYHGNNTQCEGMEACCLPDNTCVMADRLCCRTDLGGVPQGPFSQCTQPEACCLPDGTCIMVDPLCCDENGGIAQGVGSVCQGMQACCLEDNTCVMADGLCCVTQLSGVPQGPGSVCVGMEACCLPDNTCVMADALCCVNQLGGIPEGPGSTCGGWQACCLSDGTCVMADALCCVRELGGIPQGPLTVCTQREACCLANGDCIMVDPLCCGEMGGVPSAKSLTCLGDASGNGIDDACEYLDRVVCEPQPPNHPPNYWYDVTPDTFGRCDFHVRVYDANPANYTSWNITPWPGILPVCPTAWRFAVHEVAPGEWWASWWDSTPGCECAFFGPNPTRFSFTNQNPSVWGGWTTTTSNTWDPYLGVVDSSDNHPAEPPGFGYLVHVPEAPPPKWAQPPTYNPDSHHPECFWGWDSQSVYNWAVIVADDFPCDDTKPISDIHWWGSYAGWPEPVPPPNTPIAFHIGIWTNVPPGVEPFSHPGTMIAEWRPSMSELNETLVGCDYHNDWPDVYDYCYRYDFIIPQAEWFRQEPACSIYWLSIAAIYPTPDPGPFEWGWKTREHYFEDDAVQIWLPTNPVVGSVFGGGAPIERPEGVSWDMSFVLTSGCPLSDPPLVPAGEAGYEKVRYISMEPVNPGRLTALRVTMTTIPPPYDGFSGTQCWIDEPATYCENSGQVSPPCATVIPNTYFVGAGLQGTPHCMDWSTVGVLHVSDDDIVPNAVYDVQAIDCECDFSDEANYSAPLTITTSIWGDVVRNCAVYPCGPPDGLVGIPTDVTAILDKFKNLEPPAFNPSILKSRGDLDWNIPNRRIDISDVTFCLDAFRGVTYPPLPPAQWPGPNGCP